jgi:hypothetical protein
MHDPGSNDNEPTVAMSVFDTVRRIPSFWTMTDPVIEMDESESAAPNLLEVRVKELVTEMLP